MFEAPPELSFVEPDQGPDDLDSDVDPILGTTADLTVPAGVTHFDIDALLGSGIGGVAWIDQDEDEDEDGMRVPGDLASPGAVVELVLELGTLSDLIIASTTIGPDGRYGFSSQDIFCRRFPCT